MKKATSKNINYFDENYPADEAYISMDNDASGGVLETYGEDIETVLGVAEFDPKKVWTMIDGDKGIYMIAGYHLVNRINYFISMVDWEDEFEEYCVQLNNEN